MRARPPDYRGAPATVADAAAAGIALRPTRWGLGDAAIAIVGGFGIGLLFAAVVRAAGWSGSGIALLLGLVVPWVALGGWPLFATRRWGNGPRIDLGLSLRFLDLPLGVLAGVVALVLGSGAVWLSEWIIGPFESHAAQRAEQIAGAGDRWQVVGYAVLVTFAAPVVEELAFRGLLWAGLCRAGAAPVVAWLASTALFVLAHLEWQRILVLTVSGAMFGFLRLRTGRLGAPIVAHTVNNGFGAVTFAFPG